MIFAKFDTELLGQFWIRMEQRGNEQGEAEAKGIVLGWGLGRKERFELVDIRLSQHPTEKLRTLEQVQELINQL